MTIAQLNEQLAAVVPGARLCKTVLPKVPEIQLYLLNADYPQHQLDSEAVQFIMNNPLYWVFCWASGQVLAEYLLRYPHWVKGRRVVDFGCGSGVVAIAAKMAGAEAVIACDIDPLALVASKANAELNGVELIYSDSFDAIDISSLDVIIVADVLYDKANLPWLKRFAQCAETVLVADSRVKNFSVPPYTQIDYAEASTLPDLDESEAFRHVRLYAN